MVRSTEMVTEATTRELVQLPQSSEEERQGPLESFRADNRGGTEAPHTPEGRTF